MTPGQKFLRQLFEQRLVGSERLTFSMEPEGLVVTVQPAGRPFQVCIGLRDDSIPAYARTDRCNVWYFGVPTLEPIEKLWLRDALPRLMTADMINDSGFVALMEQLDSTVNIDEAKVSPDPVVNEGPFIDPDQVDLFKIRTQCPPLRVMPIISFYEQQHHLIIGRGLDLSALDFDVGLFLHKYCVNDCIFCTPLRDYRPIDFYEIVDGLKEMRSAKGIGDLLIGGGEPLTVLNLAEVVAHVRPWFRRIELMTSGNMLSVPKFAHRLVENGVTDFVVPLYGTDAAVHDAIVGVAGAFDRTVQGIRMLQAEGGRLAVTSLALRQNIAVLDDLARFVNDEFGAPFIVAPVRAMRNFSEVCTSLDEIGQNVTEAFVYSFPLCLSYFQKHDPLKHTLQALIDYACSTAKSYLSLIHPSVKLPGVCDNCSMCESCPGVVSDYVAYRGVEAVAAELRPYRA